MTAYEITDFNNYFVSFCQTSAFRNYVRAVMNDDLFWRDMWQKFNFDSEIRSKIQNDVPIIVKNEIKLRLPEQLKSKLNEYFLTLFPTQINRELNNQIPVFFTNNYQLQQILEKHKQDIKLQLEETARNILEKIIAEPQYHILRDMHLKEIDAKCAEQMIKIATDADQQIKLNRQDFEREMINIKQDVDDNLFKLKSQLDTIQSLKNDIDDFKIQHKSEINTLKWSMVGMTAIITLVFTGTAYLNKY